MRRCRPGAPQPQLCDPRVTSFFADSHLSRQRHRSSRSGSARYTNNQLLPRTVIWCSHASRHCDRWRACVRWSCHRARIPSQRPLGAACEQNQAAAWTSSGSSCFYRQFDCFALTGASGRHSVRSSVCQRNVVLQLYKWGSYILLRFLKASFIIIFSFIANFSTVPLLLPALVSRYLLLAHNKEIDGWTLVLFERKLISLISNSLPHIYSLIWQSH